MRIEKPDGELRRGWTTGACAAAATKAAYAALLSGRFPDPVTIDLPRGGTATFPLAVTARGSDWARAGVTKDAGDDPDVTHGCLVVATVRRSLHGTVFRAGPGVGTVTKPGLPIPPGEPAINPVPRAMMEAAVASFGAGGAEIEISIPGGEELAKKTWNPRLGIAGGLSILGTTGIVNPYSCAAWIASIHRGIDVARAAGITHIAGCTGSTSEAAVQALHRLPPEAMIDMGDFAGGLLKYLRDHPVRRVTIGGGIGKMAKLAQGSLDLHSSRSQVDFGFLADLVPEFDRSEITGCNTALDVSERAQARGIDFAHRVASRARATVETVIRDAGVRADTVVVDRSGAIIATG